MNAKAKRRITALLKDRFLIDTTIVFFGTSLAGLFNLLYHLVSVRLLDTRDYGTFNALVSLTMFAATAVSPLKTTLTRFFTEYATRKEFGTLRRLTRAIVRKLFVSAAGIVLVSVLVAPGIGRFLKTQPVLIVIGAVVIALSLFSLPVTSILESLQRFKFYSGLNIVSSLAKLIVGTLLMLALAGKVAAGLVGFMVPSLLMILIYLFFLPDELKKNREEGKAEAPRMASLLGYFWPVSVVMFSFTLLTNADVVLVKHFFPPVEAGYYSIAQLVGKILLFLPSSVAIVLFPKSAASWLGNGNTHKLLRKSLIVAGVLCGAVTTICFLLPDLILKILVAGHHPISTSLVPLFSVAMSFYALLWVVINFLLATNNLKIVGPLFLLAAAQTTAIYFWHQNLKSVLTIVMVFSMASFVLSLAAATAKRERIPV